MDYLWVAVAFLLGFLAKQLGLPALIGYLAAGFGLHALGVEPNPSLQSLADLGVTLLLFTIGLKINIRSLFKTEIWGSAGAHMLMILLLTLGNSLLLGYFGFAYFVDLEIVTAALIGFAVSFSSTVCAVQILEERGELRARHGQVAMGILIIQDIAAVIFVSIAAADPPSWWALSLLLLPLIRPVLFRLLDGCGHGEMLTLAGIFLALSGAEIFELVGLKGHLGALVGALLISHHSQAAELSKALLGFKDIFLIGFFLSIGFIALPTVDMLLVALVMAIALPLKSALFFIWQTGFKLRSRTAFLSALSLSNYSEFGLIVCAAAVSYGLLADEWVVIMALAVSLSFVFASLLNSRAHTLYTSWAKYLKHFERRQRLSDDRISQPEGRILVVGMGRVGTGAYQSLKHDLHLDVCGLDVDLQRVAAHQKLGRNVVVADAEDPDFWARINLNQVQLIMLTMPNLQDILQATQQLRATNYAGKLASIVHYEDERDILLEAGVDVVFNHYLNAGAGFAERSIHLLDDSSLPVVD
jgi:glutathione-regulated potassium-efflux system ancillary protein KefC